MRQIRMSGLTSGEGKRSNWPSLKPPRPSPTLQSAVTVIPALFQKQRLVLRRLLRRAKSLEGCSRRRRTAPSGTSFEAASRRLEARGNRLLGRDFRVLRLATQSGHATRSNLVQVARIGNCSGSRRQPAFASVPDERPVSHRRRNRAHRCEAGCLGLRGGQRICKSRRPCN
jgi:hypothetical protein